MAEHEHDFGWPRVAGQVRSCRHPDCTEWAVIQPLGQHRPLTANERMDLMVIQMGDIAIAQAMQIIHGRERGLAHARKILGYV